MNRLGGGGAGTRCNSGERIKVTERTEQRSTFNLLRACSKYTEFNLVSETFFITKNLSLIRHSKIIIFRLQNNFTFGKESSSAGQEFPVFYGTLRSFTMLKNSSTLKTSHGFDIDSRGKNRV
jgi:hypothetical protein